MSDARNGSEHHRVIRDVIRGERPLEDFLAVGLNTTLHVNERGWYALLNPNPDRIDVTIEARDVAAGFLYYFHHQPELLRSWAFTIYAGGFWHCAGERDEGAPSLHQVVVDALWAVNFADPIPAETVALFEQLAESSKPCRYSPSSTASDDEVH